MCTRSHVTRNLGAIYRAAPNDVTGHKPCELRWMWRIVCRRIEPFN